MKNRNFKIIHGFILLIIIFLIYLSSNFGIGSRENYAKIINEAPIEYFFSRLLFNLIVFIFPFIIVLIMNKIFVKRGIEKDMIRKSYMVHFLSFLIFSIAFILLRIYHYQ
jgi:hypothetical protein